jgi:5-methyltetrahydrofolate--homocysteine methyltransferase
MMLVGSGFNVVDLGYDVSPQQFVDAVKEHKPRIVGMSSLLTTTMGKMKDTIAAIKQSGVDEHLKFMVGGAPVNQEFADQIGADAYAENAGDAVEKAKSLFA